MVRDLERRVDALEDNVSPDDPLEPWMREWDIPRELWDERGAAWAYAVTDGESHPHLQRPGDRS